MTVVIDASMTAAWYFSDETTPQTERVLSEVARFGAVVPTLWCLEIANTFQVAVRRQRMTVASRDAALAELGELLIMVDDRTTAEAWGSTLRLADRCSLTVYDAAYLELALRRGLPLATLDKKLRAAAKSLAVPVLGQSE